MFSPLRTILVACCLTFFSSVPQVLGVANSDTSQGSVSVQQNAGEDVYLPCVVNGHTLIYVWEKNNRSVEALDAMRDSRLFLLHKKALLILNTVEGDAGEYRCTSFAGGSLNIRTYTLSIRVPDNADDADIECGHKRQRARVVNGREVDRPGLFPWMALLWHKEYNAPFCGGAVVSRQFIITAAHCFLETGYRPADVEIRLGEHNTSSTEQYERIFDVAELIPHPNYDYETYDSDILLIRLNNRLIYSDYIVPICLPSVLKGERLLAPGTTGTVAGWGSTSEDTRDTYTEVLRRARLLIRDQHMCGTQHRNNIVTNNMFCALGTGRGGTRDACNGDSGGPFVVKEETDEDRSYLVGIVSWGIGCGREDFPGVYTRVSRFRNWILQNINADQTCEESSFQVGEELGQEQNRIESMETQISDLERQLQERIAAADHTVCTTPAPIATTVTTTTLAPYVDEPIACRRGSCWHVGGYRIWGQCVNGFCQCNSPYYNAVTCLPKGGSCSIRENDVNNLHAVPSTTRTTDPTTYSCIGSPAGSRDVHVLAVYEGNVHTRPPTAGDMEVTVTTDQSATRPVVLVLSNYEPVNWILNVPTNLNVTKVILITYYASTSSVVVEGGSSDQVPIEKKPRSWPRGYGTDGGGGNTAGMLLRLSQLYTNVTSFAGTYRADSWSWRLPNLVVAQRAAEAPSTGGSQSQGDAVVSTDGWTQYSFSYDHSWTSCLGLQYVRMRDIEDGKSGKYVGAVLCTNQRYKLFMADELSDEFKNIADSSGHGSDHCQFVQGNEDDFESDDNYWHAPAAQGFFRSGWDEDVTFGTIGGGLGPQWTGRYYPKWYECGVTIP